MDNEIIKIYLETDKSLRDIAKEFGTNHKKISDIIKSNGIEIKRKPSKPFSVEHKQKITDTSKGRICWAKGKKMTYEHVLKNMLSKLNRPYVTYEYLLSFVDIEKLKFLNRVISRHRKHFNDKKYVDFLNKFYYDERFNIIYIKWLEKNKDKWMRPTLEHVTPVSKGGTFDINNLTFLTWLENRTKCDMSQGEWDNIKENINEYFI